MIDAKEARKMSEQASINLLSSICEHPIKLAIASGLCKVTVDVSDYNYNTIQSLIIKLQDLGYKVKHWQGSQIDPCNDLIIEW